MIKFTRELAQLPHLTEPARDVMCRYIEAFNSWDESKRVEQYSMLQVMHSSTWEQSGDA